MSKLSGLEIIEQIKKKAIRIDPFNVDHMGPNSYDLTLGSKLLVYEEDVLDMRKENAHREVEIPPEGLVLEPRQLYLGVTREIAGSQFFVPCIEGRSSVARLGLAVHITAGFGDVGFCSCWTLEMIAVKPVRIYAGVRICQIYFDTVEGQIVPYAGKYCRYGEQDDGVPVASRMYEDFRGAPLRVLGNDER